MSDRAFARFDRELKPIMDTLKADRDKLKRAIPDPLGYGYENRVPVSRKIAEHGVDVDPILTLALLTDQRVPPILQHDWLYAHGYYSIKELTEHVVVEKMIEISKERGAAGGKPSAVGNVEDLEKTMARWKELLQELLEKEKRSGKMADEMAGKFNEGMESASEEEKRWRKMLDEMTGKFTDGMGAASVDEKLEVLKGVVLELEARLRI